MYTAALGALLVIVGWSLYTLVDLYEPERVAASPATRFAPTTLPPATSPVVIASAPTDKALDPSWIEIVVAWIDSYISFITMGWLLGMVILSARLAGGRWYLERLRHHHTCPLPAWEAAVATLATRLRLRRPVTVMASGLAKVPLVIGHLKPLILLPTALVSNLPPEQIEAILAHELAHVRRHDYWVNMLQSLIEVIFFYHPMVWWLSSVVREEREKCCDDLAVSLCGDTLVYAKALSEAESLQHPAAPLVVAFAKRGGLLARIERLVSPRTSSTSGVTKIATLVPMLLIVMYVAGGDTLARKAVNSEPQPKTTAPAAFSQPLSIPSQSDTAHSAEKAEVKGNEPADEVPTPNASLPTDTIPNGNKDRGHFSFQFGDSSDFSFDMSFPFDDDDSTHRNGFRHWRFSSSDTFPDFAWDDSLWRESIGELSETMEGFSEELTTFLDDSVDTEALQQRLGSVQQELSRLQAELGTSLQRTFSDEKMEALQRRLQREQEQLGRDLQEKSRRLQEQQRQFQEEAQRRLQENTSEEKMKALKKELQEAQERLQRESQDEQSWRNEESSRQLEELKRLTEEMEQQPWFDDENGGDSLRLKEIERALEKIQQQNNDQPRRFSQSKEDSLKFRESQRVFREQQRQSKENQRRSKQQRVTARNQAQAHAQVHNGFDNTVNRLEEALLTDGLIKSGKEYRFELKPKGVYINKRKQDQELLVKYRDLLNVSDNTSFSITRTAR